MKGGQAFFRGFTPLDPGGDLRSFAQIYRDFESHNIVFEVSEESAFAYSSNYHPRIKYSKDRMIASGDATCHAVFVWE